MTLIEVVVTAFCSIMASSGFWLLIQRITEKKSSKSQMILGLGHDRLMSLGMYYIERGDWITDDEYENLVTWLYEPYQKMGGNGSAKRVVDEVKKLRIVKNPPAGENRYSFAKRGG